jgi:hypothetical protein
MTKYRILRHNFWRELQEQYSKEFQVSRQAFYSHQRQGMFQNQ